MNHTFPAYASFNFQTGQPVCRRHWLRGLVVGLAIAVCGLVAIWAAQRAFHLRTSPAAEPLYRRLADPVLPVESEKPSPRIAQDRRSPLDLDSAAGQKAGIDAGGGANHGEQITIDLPAALHRENTTSLGQGCCTWTSLHHAAVYQNVPAFMEAPKWIKEHRIPGGASPSDWSEHLPRMAKDRGYPVPNWIQINQRDIEFLKRALQTGRMVCVTYSGRDGVYYRRPISHMVNLVHLSDRWAVILDNNEPGRYLWMTPAEFFDRWSGWAAVLLAPPPPPIPTSKSPS